MDKNIYNMKAEKIQKQVRLGDYETAARICDSVDWSKVHNIRMLTMVSSVYEYVKDYDRAIDILLMAYEESPLGRRYLFKLTELALAAGDIREAEEYYRNYLKQAPKEPDRYLLRYKIADARGESVDKKIAILETYQKLEFDEEWSYRLAVLYAKAGRRRDCIALCDKIILWFSVGPFVEKAMRLKEKYEPLTESQKQKRENRARYEEDLRKMEEKLEAEVKPKPAPEPVPESQSEPEPEPVPESQSEPEPESVPKPEPQPEQQSAPEPQPKLVQPPKAESEEKTVAKEAPAPAREKKSWFRKWKAAKSAPMPESEKKPETPVEEAPKEESVRQEPVQAELSHEIPPEPVQGKPDEKTQGSVQEELAHEEVPDLTFEVPEEAAVPEEKLPETDAAMVDSIRKMPREGDVTLERSLGELVASVIEEQSNVQTWAASRAAQAREEAAAKRKAAEEAKALAQKAAAEPIVSSVPLPNLEEEPEEKTISSELQAYLTAEEEETAAVVEEEVVVVEEEFSAEPTSISVAESESFPEAEEALAESISQILAEDTNLFESLEIMEEPEEAAEPEEPEEAAEPEEPEEAAEAEEPEEAAEPEEPEEAAEPEEPEEAAEPEEPEEPEEAAESEEPEEAAEPEEPEEAAEPEEPEEAAKPEEPEATEMPSAAAEEEPQLPEEDSDDGAQMDAAWEAAIAQRRARVVPKTAAILEPEDSPAGEAVEKAVSTFSAEERELPPLFGERISGGGSDVPEEKTGAENLDKKKADSKRKKGRKLIYVGTPTPQEGVGLAVEALRKAYEAQGGEISQVAKISGSKLNQKGLMKSLPNIEGKDLIIAGAGSLDDAILTEIQQARQQSSPDKYFVLMDHPAAVRQLQERIRNLESGSAGETVDDKGSVSTGNPVMGTDPETEVLRKRAGKTDREGPDVPTGDKKVNGESSGRTSLLPEGEIDKNTILNREQFLAYIQRYAKEIDCVIEESGIDSVNELIDEMLEDGERLLAGTAEEIVEDAADDAERWSPRCVVHSRYNKDGKLILREKNFH